jgi:hypothetical protein
MNKAEIDIDLELFTKEQLINLIMYAHAYDITFNEAIVRTLTNFIDKNENGIIPKL